MLSGAWVASSKALTSSEASAVRPMRYSDSSLAIIEKWSSSFGAVHRALDRCTFVLLAVPFMSKFSLSLSPFFFGHDRPEGGCEGGAKTVVSGCHPASGL